MTTKNNSDAGLTTAGDPTDWWLAADELAAVRAMLATQSLLGQAAPKFTASSISELMKRIDTLSDQYPHLVSPSFKKWVDDLYALLAATDTVVYGQKFPALYLTWEVSQFPFNPPSETVWVTKDAPLQKNPGGPNNPAGSSLKPSRIQVEVRLDSHSPSSIQVGDLQYPLGFYGRGVYPAFRNSCKINYLWEHEIGNEAVQGSSREPWTPPAYPPAWQVALTNLMKTWDDVLARTDWYSATLKGDIPPQKVFPWGAGFDDYVQKHLAVLDPKSWTDVEGLKDGVARVWRSQLAEARQVLAHPEALPSEAYFYLLHLLIVLRNGNDDCQTLAANTLLLPCSSPEYPNDTFVNQIVYAALMNVADPNGAYAWDSSQRLQMLQGLRSLVVGEDPATGALQASLASHIATQNTDSAYPMQDPNTNVAFDERKTDTLAALDKSRQASGELAS